MPTEDGPTPFYQVTLSARDLARVPQQLPLMKRAVHDAITTPWRHDVEVSRHAPQPLPERPAHAAKLIIVPTPMAYEPAGDAMVWHVNFADPELFIAYDSVLLAQDELQAL